MNGMTCDEVQDRPLAGPARRTFEPKFDGVRVLAAVGKTGEVKLTSGPPAERSRQRQAA